MNASWETFIFDKLLKKNLCSGVCLLSNQKSVIYAQGDLSKLSAQEICQFFDSFTCGSSKPCHRSLNLYLERVGKEENFKIYYRTHISLYATSTGNRSCLTVSRCQHGIFLSLFHKPVDFYKAISAVETFTGMLRF